MSLLPIGGGTLNVSGTGDPTDVAAVAVNAKNHGVTEYTNYPFNSLAVIGGVVYGALADGVYALSGDDDAGTDIDAAFLTGMVDFTGGRDSNISTAEKGMDSVHVNMRSYQAPGSLRVRVNETNDYLYTMPAPVFAEGLASVRQKIGRAVVGRNWQVGYENIDGANFEIAQFDLSYRASDRRG